MLYSATLFFAYTIYTEDVIDLQFCLHLDSFKNMPSFEWLSFLDPQITAVM